LLLTLSPIVRDPPAQVLLWVGIQRRTELNIQLNIQFS